MSTTHRLLMAEVRSLAGDASGVDAAAAMLVMTMAVMAMAKEIPEQLRSGLVSASARWYLGGACSDNSLELARVASWAFLEERHGNSTTILDRTDAAVRALICILWDDADANDPAMTLEFFSSLVDRFDGLEESENA